MNGDLFLFFPGFNKVIDDFFVGRVDGRPANKNQFSSNIHIRKSLENMRFKIEAVDRLFPSHSFVSASSILKLLIKQYGSIYEYWYKKKLVKQYKAENKKEDLK